MFLLFWFYYHFLLFLSSEAPVWDPLEDYRGKRWKQLHLHWPHSTAIQWEVGVPKRQAEARFVTLCGFRSWKKFMPPLHITFYQLIKEATKKGNRVKFSEIKVSIVASANSCLFSWHKSCSLNLVSHHIFPLAIHVSPGVAPCRPWVALPQFENYCPKVTRTHWNANIFYHLQLCGALENTKYKNTPLR